jgi:predicted DNA repair protein MutK
MAGAGLIALIDDIAGAAAKLSANAADVGTLAATAGKKTAGVVGDDLALNANALLGIDPKRELPIIWKVAKGSLKNKAILVPAAVAISAAAPWAITPLLMVGGAYLCFEGVEKLAHSLLHPKEHAEEEAALAPDVVVDFIKLEDDKVAGAIRTDFILSAEIVAITLGSVANQSVAAQFAVLTAIALVMTVGVYGLVGVIVKLDDMGLYLSQKSGPKKALGRVLLNAAPRLLSFLSVAGTAAMFLVGGGIMLHGIPPLEHAVAGLAAAAGILSGVASLVLSAGVGVITGVVSLPLFNGVFKAVDAFKARRKPDPALPAPPTEPPAPPAGLDGKTPQS